MQKWVIFEKVFKNFKWIERLIIKPIYIHPRNIKTLSTFILLGIFNMYKMAYLVVIKNLVTSNSLLRDRNDCNSYYPRIVFVITNSKSRFKNSPGVFLRMQEYFKIIIIIL
jgi:hypothetical protein